MTKRRWLMLLAGAIVVLAVVVVALLPRGRTHEGLYRTEAAQRGDVRVTVSATGTLNAVTTVQVGSQVSGTISALYADFNTRVKAGQLLAQLDPTFLKAQVAQTEADLERARVTLRQAERDSSRQAPLRAQGLVSQADMDATLTAVEAARASVKSAVASLVRAETNLRYATIYSPIDGVVVSRDVDVGQTVAASLSAPTIFTIANDLSQMQLEASVDEADIGRIQTDQSVTFTVDAFPERTFDGRVQQVRLAPRTEENVVTYTVIVRVANPEQRLLPGMTANATFLVAEARDALRIPSAALRFRPDGSGNAGGARLGSGGTAHAGGPPAMSPDGSPGARGGGAAHVFVLEGNARLKRVRVAPGITDGMWTAVTSDSLREGMAVVVGQTGAAANAGQGTVNPFMPSGPGGRRGGR